MSAVLRAVKEFASDEDKRKRKRLSEQERLELDRALLAFEGLKHSEQRLEPLESANRGNVTVAMFGYDEEDWEGAAVDVLADLLWAIRARGHDVNKVINESIACVREEGGL